MSSVLLIIALSLTAGISKDELSQPTYEVRYELNVRIPMSDGVELSADMYRPDAPGRFPVILVRTPYDNNNERDRKTGMYYAQRGYIYIAQDTRGRGDSDGRFYPLINEAGDGYDTHEWIGKQEWSNGKIGSTGGSYVGWVQVYAATKKSKYYTAMIPMVTPPDPFLNVPYQNGAFMMAMLDWVILIDGRSMQDLSKHNLQEIYNLLPLADMEKAVGRNSPFWKDWLDHYSWDEYWDGQSYQEKLWKVDMPAIHMTGWFDDDQPGALMNFTEMRKYAKTIGKEKHQRLIVGPWPHALNYFTKLGDFDYGPQALIDMNELHLKWYDYWLKGKDTGILDEPPVKIFIMGDNVWRDEQEWPLARTVYTPYYFHSDGSANSRHGNGGLSTTPPDKEKSDQYVYDPADPPKYIFKPGSFQLGLNEDQRFVEDRKDVLCFTSDVLEEDLEITGPLKVKLYASSDAKDTDFVARLVDVLPDGYAMRVNDGIIRARFRNSYREPELMVPGEVYEFTIDLWATSQVFKKGHRIRIEVLSSAFPKFDRNLNTGDKPGFSTEMRKAQQTIYHNKKYPSHIILPIIPR